MLSKRFFAWVFVLIALALNTGCAVNRASAQLIGNANLSTIKTVYVVKHDADTRGVNEIIKSNLGKRGYTVTTGPVQPGTYTTDAVVTYVDKWMWDITMYMLELTIVVRDPSSLPMATGNSLHTSLTRKSPPEMVDEVLTNIFKAKN
jgi:hypothetical protein